VHFVGYLYLVDPINAMQLELVKTNNYFYRLTQTVLPRGAVCQTFASTCFRYGAGRGN